MGDIETIKAHARLERVRWGTKVIAALILLIVIVSGLFFWYRYSRYSQIQVVKVYDDTDAEDGNYLRYADGVLKYSRDGVEMLAENGEEIWNQPCQMNSPVAEICKNTAAVGDKGGTSILVFEKKGLKGEISTTKPIEKFSVSAQGIVAAILEDEETPRVVCYDAKGNVLVEHKASLINTGYPVDVAISNDGNVLLVSYLDTTDGVISTRVAYYHFGKAGEGKENHLVAEKTYADVIVPTTAFLDKKTSILISDQSLIIYEGLEKPEEKMIINFEEEIKSVSYDETYIAVLLKHTEQANYELKLFQKNGKQVFSEIVENEYMTMTVSDKQIILCNNDYCAIYNDAGVCKYQGNVEAEIKGLFPIGGFNKYMMISATGFTEIQLAK